MKHIVGLLAAASMLVGSAIGQASPGPERWEEVIRALEAAESRPEPGVVLFVGSSSIRFWSTLAEDFPSIPTLNHGFGGSGMGDLLHYADRIVIPYRPSHVVVYTGENDLSRGATAEEVHADYRAVVQTIHAQLPDARITFVSMKPSPSRRHLLEEMRRGNALVAALSATDERLAYVDVFDPMLDDDGEPRAELFVEDMLHLNEAGYALWRELLSPHVEQ